MPDFPPHPMIEVSSRKAFNAISDIRNGQAFIAVSTQGAGIAFGVPWWVRTLNLQTELSILDCGSSMACAIQALNNGIGWVICRNAASTPSSSSHPQILTQPLGNLTFIPGRMPFSPYVLKKIQSLEGYCWQTG
ncbi:hypothetical protein JK185_15365 [Gluconobacter wancherniae]|uniref:hypothetical protein n=1 Tax=Gluconobacter wancherniae TaxID=1307955 RepID=UPI001B8B11AE|nr:hypothetical protein [Gluconobacter wancherniae]MBS1064352.1 hypothetical protein [Gluconobacter wancherniae]